MNEIAGQANGTLPNGNSSDSGSETIKFRPLSDGENGERFRRLVEGAREYAIDEELFRRLVESVRDYAIFMLDPAGRIVTWNAGAQRIKGYSADEIIGQNFSVFYPDEDVRSGKCEYELEEAARVGRFEDEGWRIRKDGSSFWANVVISAVRDDDGRLLGFSKVTRDLTERKKAEEDRAARLAAEEANKDKDEFVAVLGHELRNHIAAIATAIQLMKLHGEHGSSREHQIIERQVRHMTRLIDDLLDVSRATKGKITLKKQRLDLRDVLAKSVEVASPLLEQRGHQLEIEMQENGIFLEMDDARMTQVFANLLINAAKYTPSGGHIGLRARQDDEEVFVEVRDDGVGIAPEFLPKVFDLFVQGHRGPEGAKSGLGIGLTLVRSLVAMHGGSVEAQSSGEGMGSTFIVRLPAVSAPRVDPLSGANSLLDRRALKGCRVLLVDDNEDAVLLLAEALSAAGHEVKTAFDAAQALAVARDFKPDVAVLDIGLPVMNGYHLASRLRAELEPRAPRLIALSGYGRPDDRDLSDRAGFDAHLVKPTDVDQLVDAISRCTETAGADPPLPC